MQRFYISGNTGYAKYQKCFVIYLRVPLYQQRKDTHLHSIDPTLSVIEASRYSTGLF